jgi:flagellar assembly protein FliH
VEKKSLFEIQSRSDEVRSFPFDRLLSPEPAGNADEVMDPEDLKRMAFEEGHRLGEQAGFDSGLKKAKEVLDHLLNLIKGLDQARAELYTKLEEEIVDLSVKIAERIVYREIQLDPSARKGILETGLKRLKDSDQITVRVAPEVCSAVRETLPELCEKNGISANVRIADDPDVCPGDYVLETDRCEIDGRVKQALQLIEEALRGS